MTSSRITVLIFGVYAWSILVNGKAIDDVRPVQPAPATDSEHPVDLLPPLIFPTDKKHNNIVPINKTAIKILMHEDDYYNSSSSGSSDKMTKDDEVHKEVSNVTLSPRLGEADDLRKTDEKIAKSEEEHAEYSRHHPEEKVVETEKVVTEQKGYKDQVENIQEGNSKGKSELEEQFNRPDQNYMSVSILNVNQDSSRHHTAWISALVSVVSLGVAICAVLLYWRHKLEQRYGNRHQLFTNDEDNIHDITL